MRMDEAGEEGEERRIVGEVEVGEIHEEMREEEEVEEGKEMLHLCQHVHHLIDQEVTREVGVQQDYLNDQRLIYLKELEEEEEE